VEGGKQGAQAPVHTATKAASWESRISVSTTCRD
jgi:hypothetical protein